jgi:hypothetical protein
MKKIISIFWILVSLLGFILVLIELIALADAFNVPM